MPGAQLRISMVVPAHNEECELPGLLESIGVARARYDRGPTAIEVVVADNASTDRTPHVARRRYRR